VCGRTAPDFGPSSLGLQHAPAERLERGLLSEHLETARNQPTRRGNAILRKQRLDTALSNPEMKVRISVFALKSRTSPADGPATHDRTERSEMKITATEEYGMRCMLRLAQRAGETVAITELAAAEGVAEPFAAKVLASLRRAGLVLATRGRHGGYRLATKPSEITVGWVLRALGKPLYDAAFCREHGASTDACCTRQSGCSLRPVWRHLDLLFDAFFAHTTLADLLAGERSTSRHLASRWPLVAPPGTGPYADSKKSGEGNHAVNR
jgi:Rrf2 family iron-sulfur cluster assembly transcriptional regulator